ncbi:MAG TPA: hypothetical protein VFH94_24720 [Streptomyces sp.]|nr:hypothetical protein [Streptomyces sp.]
MIEGRPTRFPPQSPRVRWRGVLSGVVVALGVLLLLGTLGLALGVTALGDPRAATGETASSLGIGGGVWAFITLLVAVGLGGLVSTTVTNRPDRTGALLHGALVWTLVSLGIVWMLASGISLGLSGLFGAVSGLAQSATTAVAAGGGDLVQALGLHDATQVLARLDNPATAATLATATGMSTAEATAALGTLRPRVDAVRDDPARVTAEVRDFVAPYAARAKEQAMDAAAAAQRGAKTGAWMTVGVMVVSLGVALAGAMAGMPSRRRRGPLVEARG